MLRDILTEKDEKDESKMLAKLHGLDDTIEDFISGLEDKINAIEDNPMFIKKAHQLLANMSKEYSEFIMALRGVVNAVDRKGQVLPTEPMKPSKPRDVNIDAGEEEEGDEEVEVGSPPENESKIYKVLKGE